METKELSTMIEEYLKTKKIKYIGKKPKRDTFKTNDIITIHTYDSTIKVL